MKYRIEYTENALKQLKKLDKSIAAMIIGYIEKNLVDSENPRSLGKPLVDNHNGKWRYRIGNYRILSMIDDGVVLITIIEVGHRKDIYK